LLEIFSFGARTPPMKFDVDFSTPSFTPAVQRMPPATGQKPLKSTYKWCNPADANPGYWEPHIHLNESDSLMPQIGLRPTWWCFVILYN